MSENLPPLPSGRVDPPPAVTQALATLHDACAAWPIVTPAKGQNANTSEANACSFIVDMHADMTAAAIEIAGMTVILVIVVGIVLRGLWGAAGAAVCMVREIREARMTRGGIGS